MPREATNTKDTKEAIAIRSEYEEKFSPLFLQALRDVLPNLRLYSDLQLAKKIGPERLMDCSLEFFGFIISGAGDGLRKNELLALANQSLRCLIEYIQLMGSPITLKTVIDHTSLLAEAVNRCFPGYADNKLLKYTILPQQVTQ